MHKWTVWEGGWTVEDFPYILLDFDALNEYAAVLEWDNAAFGHLCDAVVVYDNAPEKPAFSIQVGATPAILGNPASTKLPTFCDGWRKRFDTL